MNVQLLQAAQLRIPNIPVLVNMVSQRVHQLINGQRPLFKLENPDEELEDIALREIADGLIVAEIDFSEPKKT